jgi:hypothetical protein
LIRGVDGFVGPGRLTKAIGITGRLNAKVASEETGVWFSEAPILSIFEEDDYSPYAVVYVQRLNNSKRLVA